MSTRDDDDDILVERMALRDYFAAAAMQGWLASFGPEATHPGTNNKSAYRLAVCSYAVADAMIEEREQ